MLEPETETLGHRLNRLRPIYISVFLAQVIAMGAVITWREWVTGGQANPYDLLIAVILKMDDVSYLALITSILIVDFGRYLVGLLIKAPQDRAYERGLSQGRQQGVAEGRQQGVAEGRQQGVAEGRQQGVVEGRQQGVVEGRQQGAAEERQRWLDYGASVRDYNRRFKDALDKGEPFDEPPPPPPEP